MRPDRYRYEGVVLSFDPETGDHEVAYDDTTIQMEPLNSGVLKWEWLPPAGRAAGYRLCGSGLDAAQ